MATPCILCKERTGYPPLNNCCPRCARDSELYRLTLLRDKAELEWSDYADLIYRIEVHEGLRPPPLLAGAGISDRPDPHGAVGDLRTGVSSTRRASRFSPLMKQGPGRSLTEDDLT
jgi:hypothetical protein